MRPSTMTAVRGPPLSSQKYKSFHYSRVASVAEEDYYDASTAPSSYAGSFNCNVETEDNTSLDTIMGKQTGRSQESNFHMIDESSAGAGNSEPVLNRPGSSSLSVQQATSDRGSGATPRRLERLVLSPPSLHMSFDVDNHPWQSQSHQRLTPEKPISKSSDNVAHRLHVGVIGEDMQHLLSSCAGTTGHPPSPAHSRHSGQSAGGGIGATIAARHHGGQPFEIAQISAGYMRTSGALGQFRGVLSAPGEKTSMLRMNFIKKQNSKEKEKHKKESSGTSSKKNSFSTTTLTALFGHHHQKDVPEPATCPTSVDEPQENLLGGVSSIDVDHSSPRHSASKQVPADDKEKKHSTTSAPEETENTKCYRLEYHRALFHQRRKTCDYSFAFALIGIVLMIFETELSSGVYTKESVYSYALKSLIVLSTLVLLSLIIAYHATDIRLFMLDHGCDDWRIAIRTRRLFLMALELLVCMICPIPGDFYFNYNNSSTSQPIPSALDDPRLTTVPAMHASTRVPIDVILSIPMFLRLYLICRLMLLHSKLFTDGPSRSISALNRVNITARLVLKMMMTVSPVSVLLAFTGSFWLTAAWIMLVCERYGVHPLYQSYNGDYDGKRHQSVVDWDTSKHESYLNSVWLVAVTSLTVGYGDIVPNTYCGRTVSIVCGIVGAGTSSLVVAVVAKKLEFSRAEKHVHNFMMDSLLTKRMKNAAANVLRETWLIYKNRKLVEKIDSAKIRHHQRKFLMAIYELRKTKRGKRKLDENFITVADMAKTTSMMYEMVAEMRTRQQEMEQKICDTEKRCANVEAYIGQLQISICALPELVARKLRQSSPMR